MINNSNTILLAMLGCTPGNGHQSSLRAMFNGFDLMTRECQFDSIPVCLTKEPAKTPTISGGKVAHICFTIGYAQGAIEDTFLALRSQLKAFIACIRNREQNGCEVNIKEITL